MSGFRTLRRWSAALVLLFTAGTLAACNFSSLTLNSEVALGGGMYQFTLTVCTPGGCDAVDIFNTCIGSQMNDNTGNWAVGIDPSATITGFTSSVSSSQNGAVFNGALSSGNTLVTYTNNTNWWSYEDIGTVPTTLVCGTITITTNGLPDEFCAYGLEGADNFAVPPSCPQVSGVTCADVTLPVDFLDFRIEQEGESAHLYWMTLMEMDHHEFTVEQSVNGGAFEAVGTVPGAGDSDVIQQYDFVHRHLRKGANTFRITSHDYGGATVHTNSITLHYAPPTLTLDRIYPNPVRDRAHIEFLLESAGPVYISLLDAAGRRLYEQMHTAFGGRNTVEVATETLAPGAYTVAIRSATGRASGRLLKQ